MYPAIQSLSLEKGLGYEEGRGCEESRVMHICMGSCQF